MHEKTTLEFSTTKEHEFLIEFYLHTHLVDTFCRLAMLVNVQGDLLLGRNCMGLIDSS